MSDFEPVEEALFVFSSLAGSRPLPTDRQDYQRQQMVNKTLQMFFEAVDFAPTESMMSDCRSLVESYRRQHVRSAVAPVTVAAGIFVLRAAGFPSEPKAVCEKLGTSRRLVARVLSDLQTSSPKPRKSLKERATDMLDSLVPKLGVEISGETLEQIRSTMNILADKQILSPASLSTGVLGAVLFLLRKNGEKLSVRELAAAAQVPVSSTYVALREITAFFARPEIASHS